MRVDAHQHFWNYDPVRDTWITEEMQAIRRDFGPDDLKPILDELAMDGCVVVQVDQSESENDFLLGLAAQNPWIKGVVGWLDLKSADLEERIAYYKTFDSFKGVRHILQAEPDGFMTDPKFVEGVSILGAKGLTYDILTKEVQLKEAVGFVDALPSMKLVINHISKPVISEASYDHWARHMKLLSERPNVYVKLSGMITEADWKNWTVADLKPYIDFCLEHFGPKRLMFGSDWPVCLVAGSYPRVYEALTSCISALSAHEQAFIFGKTATDFYELN